MWDGYPAAVEHANRGNYIQNILDFVKEDEDPEVRAAAIYAMGTYMGCPIVDSINNRNKLYIIASEIAKVTDDACWLVRKEIVYRNG